MGTADIERPNKRSAEKNGAKPFRDCERVIVAEPGPSSRAVATLSQSQIPSAASEAALRQPQGR